MVISAATWVTIIQFLIAEAFQIYKFAKQNQGEGIPTWEEIIQQNKGLADKIEAELKGGA